METTINDLKLGPVGAHTGGTDISSAVVLSPSAAYNPAKASKVVIQAVTKNVRYTLNGTTPTATLGFVLTAGNDPIVIPLEGVTLTVIEESATASLQFQMA